MTAQHAAEGGVLGVRQLIGESLGGTMSGSHPQCVRRHRMWRGRRL